MSEPGRAGGGRGPGVRCVWGGGGRVQGGGGGEGSGEAQEVGARGAGERTAQGAFGKSGLGQSANTGSRRQEGLEGVGMCARRGAQTRGPVSPEWVQTQALQVPGVGFGPGLGPQPRGYLGPAPRRVRSQGPCPWGSCLARSDRSTAEPRPHRPRGGSVGSPQGRGGGCWSPSPESCVSAAANPEASATSVPGRSVTSLRSSGLSGGHPPPSPPASRGRFWARVLPSTRPAALVLRPPSRPPAEHAPQACPLPGALTSPLTLAASSLPPTPHWGSPPTSRPRSGPRRGQRPPLQAGRG